MSSSDNPKKQQGGHGHPPLQRVLGVIPEGPYDDSLDAGPPAPLQAQDAPGAGSHRRQAGESDPIEAGSRPPPPPPGGAVDLRKRGGVGVRTPASVGFKEGG